MNRITNRTVLAALTAATLGLGFAGCEASVSTDKTVNTGEAETQIAAGLTEQLGGEVEVSCPDDVKAEKDATFECEATSPDGETATVTVTQKDDKGNIKWAIE